MITCPVILDIANETIDYSSLGIHTTDRYNYGTTATYQCNSGHVMLTIGDNERTCTGDGSSPSGQWNGTAPQCGRTFYYCNWSYHMTIYTHSCGL